MAVNNSTFKWGVAKWIVDPVLGSGTHQTITAAYNDASAGDTIFVRPGTYTENPTVKAGVNLTAFTCDAYTPNVTLVGTLSFSTAGTSSVSGIALKTNSSFAIAVTGSAASILNFINCSIICSNNTGISFTSTSGSSSLTFRYCLFDTQTTGIAYWTNTTTGFMAVYSCDFSNSGASSTASSTSSGNIFINFSYLRGALSTSSTGVYQIHDSVLDCAIINTAVLTAAGTNTNNTINNSTATSGTASCLIIGSGCIVAITGSNFASTNTNVFTGAGSLLYAFIAFSGSSSGHNVTTESPFATLI